MARSEDSNQYPKAGRRSQRRHRLVEWVLLTGNRLAIAGLLLGLIGAILVALEVFGLTVVQGPTALFYLFSAFIGGNLTLITIVISINQLVLARQFQSPGDLQSQLSAMDEYRQEVADLVDRFVMSVFPPEFLQQLLQSARQQAWDLDDSVSDLPADQAHDEVRNLVTALLADIDHVMTLLDDSEGTPFHALSTMLTTNIGPQIQRTRHVRAIHRADLSNQTLQALDSLVDHLRLLDITREYFKTIFIQKELAYFSRILFYVGITTVFIDTIGLLWSPGGISVITPSILPPGVVLVAVTVSFAPLAVLFSFVLRIAVVVERTVSILPFVTPQEVYLEDYHQ